MKFIVHPLPVISLQNTYIICTDTSTKLVLNPGKDFIKTIWNNGTSQEKNFTVVSPGDFNVTVTDKFGCVSSKDFVVKEICPPRLFVSSAFTPNKDKDNENYNVYGAHIGAFRMLIFNRWGEVIFESTDMKDVWDGTYKGEPMPIGVYPWIITYQGDSEQYKGPFKIEGSVTVIK